MDENIVGLPDLTAIGARAGTIRRVRMLSRTGLVLAAVALTGTGVALAAYVGGDDPGANVPSGTEPTSDPRGALLEHLAASPVVRQYLFFRTDLPGVVLCGLNTMGEAAGARSGTRDLYVWLECGAYRTRPTAESLTGGADPAIVTVRDGSDGPRIEGIEFPPPHYTFDELGEMFPPDVVDKLRSPPLTVSPTDEERVATAAQVAPAG